MKIVTTPMALMAATAGWRSSNTPFGLVPTMGALHEGHATLIRESRKTNAHTVVSIFVNPTQFGPNEDLARYPRTPEADEALLEKEGVDILYRPDASVMYPEGFVTTVAVKDITAHLCGPFRPGHFDGVATIVAKLLNQAQATRAYFGQKDWQQLQVVTHMARDLDIPTGIIGVPTVREADGLALSSRNRYLNADERKAAAAIPRVLKKLAGDIAAAPANIPALLTSAREALTAEGFRLDYLELAGAGDCTPRTDLAVPARVFVAARIGTTRLIDNWPV
jgi:pantoate--beta-alanine ligase